MNGTAALPRKNSFGETMRADVWWAQPLLVFLGLSAFIVYSTWAAFQGTHYYFGNYISPFYSPEIFGGSPHSWFGPKPNWWPSWLVFSPALFILWAPGGFRLTCYYYRGAYYKAFWADPPACTVGEPRKTYLGERSFPLIMQNVHRYFLYLALIFILILSYDVWKALWFNSPVTGGSSFGIVVGTIVLAINVVLLSGDNFGCHSLPHFICGLRDQLPNFESFLQLMTCRLSWQCGRARQLASGFRRHDAGRSICESVAHGRVARERSAGPRARTGSMGSSFRSHRRRAHSAAQFWRPQISAACPCRRPYRSGDDSHPARSWRAPRHRRAHGTHDPVDLERWRSRRWRLWLRTPTWPLQNFSSESNRARNRRNWPRLQNHQ